MSMTCPVCNGKSKCVDSRKSEGFTKRRFYCLECGLCFHSLEAVVAILGPSQPHQKAKLDKAQRMALLAKEILEAQCVKL